MASKGGKSQLDRVKKAQTFVLNVTTTTLSGWCTLTRSSVHPVAAAETLDEESEVNSSKAEDGGVTRAGGSKLVTVDMTIANRAQHVKAGDRVFFVGPVHNE